MGFKGVWIWYAVFISLHICHIGEMAETKPFRENLPCGIKCNFFFQIAYQICIILTASFELAVVMTTWNYYRINSDFMAENFGNECGEVAVKEAYHLTNAKDMAAPVG